MKKMKIFALMLLAGATVFTSCKKDEETTAGPSISFANGISSYEISNTATFPWSQTITATVTAEGEIKTMSVRKKDATGASSTVAITGSYAGKTSFTETFTISCAATDNYPLEIIFSVTDKNDQGMDKTFTITLQGSSGTPFAQTKSGQFYHIAGLLKGAYDLDGDAEVASSGTASAKSMKNTDVAGSAFTGSWMSDAANGTQYVKANTYDYTNATVESATSAYAAGTASATVTNPAANDIYIGKKGTTYYVIKITAVEPTYSTGTGGNQGRITFGYKKN
jgi:hypothetical protein